MPYSDRDVRRAYNRDRLRQRRAEVLARRPCPCGAPSTTVLGVAGLGRLSWSVTDEKLEAALDARRVRCDECATREREDDRLEKAEERAERQRASNRAYAARQRARPEPKPEPEPESRPTTLTARRKKAAQPNATLVTVFDDPAWRRSRARERQLRRAALGMTSMPDDDD